MTIATIYTEACNNKARFAEYTGISHDRFVQLLHYFSVRSAKNSSHEEKLFAICYAKHKQLSGRQIGDLLFTANHSRDGNNFLATAGASLETAIRNAPQAAPAIPEPVVVKVEPPVPVPKPVNARPVVVKKEAKDYLGLPTVPGDCIITHAPLNSSGDIYHIMAYLILSSHFKKTVPNVMLTYDTDGTELQVDRGHNFARSLSYGSFFKAQKIEDCGAYYPNARQKQLVEYLNKTYPKSTAYLDQMATTSVIAQLFLKLGFEAMTDILRQGFANYNNNFFPKEAQDKVKEYVDKHLQQINNNSQKPIVVLHIRYSQNANNNLNLPDNLVSQLIGYLNQKGFETWCITADDRVKYKFPYQSDYGSTPFKHAIKINGVDYSKFQHLQLMAALATNPRIKGVVGNTSGTLDACAFVGNKVYNIHQFNAKISYQDFRLSMQFSFLSIEDLNVAEIDRKNRDQTMEQRILASLPNFESWLLQNHNTTPSVTYEDMVITKDHAGYEKMFYVFLPEKPQELHGVEHFQKLVCNTLADVKKEQEPEEENYYSGFKI